MDNKTMTTAEKTTVLRFLAGAYNYSLSALAKECGLSEKAFNERLNSWNWRAKEMLTIYNTLHLKVEVFNSLFSVANVAV